MTRIPLTGAYDHARYRPFLTELYVTCDDFCKTLKTQAQLTGLVYTNGFEPYKHLDYGKARHQVEKGKSQTYSVEGFHANVRHYLARMAQDTLRYSLVCCLAKGH